MKHTKGPWKAIKGPHLEGYVVTDSNFRVCETLAVNADLLAAAPEMLDALIDAESALFHIKADGGINGPEDLEAAKLAWVKTRAAIAKAKGGAE